MKTRIGHIATVATGRFPVGRPVAGTPARVQGVFVLICSN